MAYTVPTAEPTTFTAGDSIEWDRTLGDYTPDDGWVLSYALTGAHSTVITITTAASSDGAYHEVRVTPATTADYTAGRYNLAGFVTHTDGRRFRVYFAACMVLANPVTAAPEISFNEQGLARVRAKIKDREGADISSYSLEQQEVHREELRILYRQEKAYAEAVRRERGGAFLQNVAVEFGNAA